MKVVALQLARRGSEGVPGKNKIKVNGKPLFLYPLEAALETTSIQSIFVSSDDEYILEKAIELKVNIIRRPKEFSHSSASIHDAMIHGIKEIEKLIGEVDIVVILLGNSAFTTSPDLKKAIEEMKANPKVTAIQSVSKFDMFNPMRAFEIVENKLQTIINQNELNRIKKLENTSHRSVAGDVYFFNGSFFICRKESIMNPNNLLPFGWLGDNPKPFVQGFAIELDALWQLPLIVKND